MLNLKYVKEGNIYLQFLIIFILTIILFYEIIPLLYFGGIRVLVYISELKKLSSFWISTRIICEIILMGPVFAIIYYFMMKRLIVEIDIEKGKNKYYVALIEIGVLTFMCISVMGHTIHMLFDQANRVYYNSNDGMDTSELYSLLYYSDEWLGHHLIHIAYSGYIAMALITEFLGENHKRLRNDELIYTICCGVGMGLMFGYSTYEGQAAVLVVILCIILLIADLIIILVKKINILERPILICTIILSIIVICLFIWWVVVFGLKPYYPYIYQPSEM